MIAFLITVLILFAPNFSAAANCSMEVEINGVIGPSTLDLLQRVQARAAKNNCVSTLLLINTPGGSLQTTRLLVEEILNSPIPILCLVHPSGGHAGSAGAIILQSCHVAGAMEATNIGAATPISGMGKDIPGDLRKKLINDTRSWLDGLTKLRGRSKQFGQDIITEAKAVAAAEALKLNAIDFVAGKKLDFIKFAEGREVKLSEQKTTKVEVGDLMRFEPDLRHKLVSMVTDPQIAYMMLMGSIGLLYFEITHPGMIAPGVIGGVGLVLSLVSLHKLNVTWGGVLLILLGIAFMIAEAFVPSFGILGLGGMGAFLMGSIFLFDPATSGYQLPFWELVFPTTFILGVVTLLIARLAYRSFNVKRRGAYDDMIGTDAVVVGVKGKNADSGLVELRGETWKFKSNAAVAKGDMVEVLSHKGFTLKVKKSTD